MTEMSLPGGGKAPCENCGYWGHEHDKEKVFNDGRWHWEYSCPDANTSTETLLERAQARIGPRAYSFVPEEFMPDNPGAEASEEDS